MSGGERRAQGTQDVEYADREEDLTAAVDVREPTADDRAEDRSDRRDGDQEALAEFAEVEDVLQGVGGAGDDSGVESEDQAADRGDDRAANDERRDARTLRRWGDCSMLGRTVDSVAGRCCVAQGT